MKKTWAVWSTLILVVGALSTTTAFGREGKKPTRSNYREFKRACLAENPGMQGKALQSCIKAKRKERQRTRHS